MALKSGMNASIGFVTEAAYGTYLAPTRWVPLDENQGESLTKDIDRIESGGIIAGQRVLRSAQWAPGSVMVEGDLGFELYDRSIGLLFTHMFGSVATSGAGPYTHTFTPGDLTGKSLTVQIGKPNTTDGTVHPFSATGVKVTSWEVACAAGEVATLGLSVVAKDMVTSQTLVAPTYASGIGVGMTFVGATVTLAGTAYKTREVTIAGDNGLDTERIFIGQDTIEEPLEAALREYTGTIDSEFFDLTAYNRFVNGTEAALVVAFAKGASTCTFTMNVRFDGETPQVEDRGIVPQSLPYKCVGSTTDGSAITAVLVNTDTTP